MNSNSKPPDAAQLLRDLQANEALKHQRIAEAGLDPALALLRVWQSERLARTYADLLDDKQYRPACEFFLSDIYAARDFSQRDHDLERIHATVSHIAPPQIEQALTKLVELNRLTNQLDGRLVRVLTDQLGVTDTLTPEIYAAGYRLCDNYAERVHQIDLTTDLLTQVGGWAHLLVVGLALKIVRVPAHQAGWVDLYDFLEHGYAAFRRMRDVPKFVATVDQRERRILDQIFASQPDPFAL